MSAPEVLLPCPFCGGKADWGYHDHSHGDYTYCTECGVEVSGTSEMWNRRPEIAAPGLTPTPGDVEQCAQPRTKFIDGEYWFPQAEMERFGLLVADAREKRLEDSAALRSQGQADAVVTEEMIARGVAAIAPPVIRGESTYRSTVIDVLTAALAQQKEGGRE